MTSPTSTETELKFLIKGSTWKKNLQGLIIQQRYISHHPERSVRIRTYGDRAFITIKGERISDANAEYEWEIDYAQAAEMLSQEALFEGALIRKKRYVIVEKKFSWKGQSLKWELDEFLDENAPLQVAEIELSHMNNAQEKQQLTQLILDHAPSWLGDYLDMSDDPDLFRYVNANLSMRPFSHWSHEEQAQMLRHL